MSLFTYVDNVVAANLAAMRAHGPLGGGAWNVGTSDRTSLLGLVAAMNRVLGTDLGPEFEAARPDDVRDSQASIEQARAVLGYNPSVGFEEGLHKTLKATPSAARRG